MTRSSAGPARVTSADHLGRGREAYAGRAWGRAYEALAAADRATPLAGDDLERLAVSAYLVGRDEEFLHAFERGHRDALERGDAARAARCAFWIALRLMLRGEIGPASGWVTRAQRLLDREARECVEQGYLLLLPAEQRLQAGDQGAAHATAARAAAIGEKFRDPDLIAAARHVQGRALLREGRVAEGLALLDEAMVAVTAGELSSLMTGLVYCSVIESCQEVYALGRAREWTAALARWCDAQTDLVTFTNTCRVHRAEVLQLDGAWRDALEEARRACARFSEGLDTRPPAAALYQQAEIHRLRGEFEAAERAYRDASRWGHDPQPGLALLRLAQGRVDAAVAAIRRAVGGTGGALPRTRLLPACVDIMLAAGQLDEARTAAAELETAARTCDTEALRGMAAQARGAVQLAAGDAHAALGSLREAWRAWQEVGAPHPAARARVLIALACRLLGDEDGCRLELDAARRLFERLEAASDVARVDALLSAPRHGRPGGLTGRELEVLRLIAAGKTNRAIAADLSISDKTVARHVSNIFTKLGLSTRAAATAYAFRHHLT